MNTCSKLVAAALGLAVAACSAGIASATTVSKSVKTHAVAAQSATIVRKPHRLHVGTPIVKHVRIVHRAPVVGMKTIVRAAKRPLLQKVASAHRLVIKKTIIR